LRACQATAAYYTDIAEPAEFIAAVNERATALGVSAVSGCSTVPGLVRVLAQRWANDAEVRSLRVYLSLGSRNPHSPTLIYSLLRPLGRSAPDGETYYRRLRGKPLRDGGLRHYGRYPAAFEREALTVGARALPATFFVGMDRRYIGWLLKAASPVLPLLSDRALGRWCKVLQPATLPVRWTGQRLGLLCLEALDSAGRVVDEVEVRAPANGLDVPSLPPVWVARRWLVEGVRPAPGPVSLETVLTASEALRWLRDDGYPTWESRPGPVGVTG